MPIIPALYSPGSYENPVVFIFFNFFHNYLLKNHIPND